MSIVKTKKCTKCGVEHTGTIEELSKEFSWNNKAKRVLSSLCKTCNRERTRNFRNANKDRYNSISRQWREENNNYYKEQYNNKKELLNVIESDLSTVDDDKLQRIERILSSRLKSVRKEIEKRK